MPPKIPGFGAEPHSMLFNVLRRSLIILVLFHESVGFIPTDSAEYPKFDAPVRGVMITYYMKKGHPDFTNEKTDEYVLIVFDNDKKLIDISTNVPTLSFPLNGK